MGSRPGATGPVAGKAADLMMRCGSSLACFLIPLKNSRNTSMLLLDRQREIERELFDTIRYDTLLGGGVTGCMYDMAPFSSGYHP
jgi:hypothetical protein